MPGASPLYSKIMLRKLDRVLKNIIYLITALMMISPGAALAGSEKSYEESQQRYLQTASEYREKASELSGAKGQFERDQQVIIEDLVRVYVELADIKEDLAAAIGARNWDTEERLEKNYYALKAGEEKLWDDLERGKNT